VCVCVCVCVHVGDTFLKNYYTVFDLDNREVFLPLCEAISLSLSCCLSGRSDFTGRPTRCCFRRAWDWRCWPSSRRCWRARWAGYGADPHHPDCLVALITDPADPQVWRRHKLEAASVVVAYSLILFTKKGVHARCCLYNLLNPT
jgi:hypothetical protein